MPVSCGASPPCCKLSGLHLVSNQSNEPDVPLRIALSPRCTIMVIPDGEFERLEPKFCTLRDLHFITISDILNLLLPSVTKLGYRLRHGVFTGAGLPPALSAAVRHLTPADSSSLDDLRQMSHPLEWSHSGIERGSENAYGYFADERLVAFAHYTVDGDVAELGVLCHPEFRGRGYTAAATTAVIRETLEKGLLPVYQTLSENRPSVRMASKLGCVFFTETFKVHLTE